MKNNQIMHEIILRKNILSTNVYEYLCAMLNINYILQTANKLLSRHAYASLPLNKYLLASVIPTTLSPRDTSMNKTDAISCLDSDGGKKRRKTK